MSDPDGSEPRRWPASVYGVGAEPDPRMTLANERTFLAWIRTSLGFLAAGIAVVALAQIGAALRPEIRIAAVLLIGCGLACALGAYVRWRRIERALRLGRPLPASAVVPLISVLLVVAVAAVVLVSVA